ncbi:hypothetical protein H310_10909 [Aphanomyces invadans]|uniref:WRKY19-like zinc finger domain-containing protein n=1 Tax=Aphanomyces invadans TaxID=157072 RepID=A0A024TP14_9STRA|nr:hypothetical protein H310_10909 [Aphanomyces invadans]ETV95870.1 hypothetical protein H310_10909 [Aphanomyces invadans]RHY22240.1 hypothetical protein DYB32_009559 [Aphanomyces invadans]|eukprot:XP_008875621.1 hypothetical protein H310_10909 [Aphanomyces invadans]
MPPSSCHVVCNSTQWNDPIPFSLPSDLHALESILEDPELIWFLDDQDAITRPLVGPPAAAAPQQPPRCPTRTHMSSSSLPAYAFPLAVQRSVSASSYSTADTDGDDDLTCDSYNSRRKLCAMAGCGRNVRSKGFCKSHGGGKQCMMADCQKEAQNGNYCIGHGGGKCCKVFNCSNAAQSQGLCKAHGGGARCKFDHCDRSSQGGGFCRSHGGGKRCDEPGCTKGAQRGNKCAKHGGCRTCTVGDCVRTDRGGGLCELHRKDKLCIAHGCKRLRKSMDMCTPHVREWRAFHGDLIKLEPTLVL